MNEGVGSLGRRLSGAGGPELPLSGIREYAVPVSLGETAEDSPYVQLWLVIQIGSEPCRGGTLGWSCRKTMVPTSQFQEARGSGPNDPRPRR